MNESATQKDKNCFSTGVSPLGIAVAWCFFLFIPALIIETSFEEQMRRDERTRQEVVKRRLFQEMQTFKRELDIGDFLGRIMNDLEEKNLHKATEQNAGFYRKMASEFEKRIGGPIEGMAWFEFLNKRPAYHFRSEWDCTPHEMAVGFFNVFQSARFLQGGMEGLRTLTQTAEFKKGAEFLCRRFGPLAGDIYGFDIHHRLPIFNPRQNGETFWFCWGSFGRASAILDCAYLLIIPQSSIRMATIMESSRKRSRGRDLQRFFQPAMSLSNPKLEESDQGMAVFDFLPGSFVQGNKVPAVMGVRASKKLYSHPLHSSMNALHVMLWLPVVLGVFLGLALIQRSGVIPLGISGKIVLGIASGIWIPLIGLVFFVSSGDILHRWLQEQEMLDFMENRLGYFEKTFQAHESDNIQQIWGLRRFLEKNSGDQVRKLLEPLTKVAKKFGIRMSYVRADGEEMHGEGLGADTNLKVIKDIFRGYAYDILRNVGALEPFARDQKKMNDYQRLTDLAQTMSESFLDKRYVNIILALQGIYTVTPGSPIFQRFVTFLVYPGGDHKKLPAGVVFVAKIATGNFTWFLHQWLAGELFKPTPAASKKNPVLFEQKHQGFLVKYGFYSISNTKMGRIPGSGYPGDTSQNPVFRALGQKCWDDRTDLSVNELNNREGQYLGVARLMKNVTLIGVAVARPLEESRFPWPKLVLLIAGAFSMMVSLAYGTAAVLVRSLKACLGAIRETATGKLDWQLKVDSGDEIGEMAQTLNSMVAGVREREMMKRYVSEEVLEVVASDDEDKLKPGGERRLVTILFSDIRSFTTLSETYPAEEIVTMLNTYFTRMESCIRAHGGAVDKFIGDAVMATFRDRPNEPEQAVRACLAALDMRRQLGLYNEDRRNQGLFEIASGVGIASGEVILGNIGSSQGRLDLTVIGEAVTLASQVEAESKKAKKSGIVLAPATVRLLRGQGRVEFLDRIQLKGKNRPISLYELIDLR